MRVVGLVTEYNPFHNGHLYHLQKALELSGAEYSIAVMSGHFLQRGEPALLDKWVRAEMAVAAGVDLIIELPYVFSCRSAFSFARGAVSLLNKTGVVSHLCFGSELGNIEPLKTLAGLFLDEPPEFKKLTKKYLKQGLTLPSAQTKALYEYVAEISETVLDPEVLNNPNNILGIEYLRSLQILNSDIEPLTVQRKAAGYHDKNFVGSFASATSIREFLGNEQSFEGLKQVIPNSSLKILKRSIGSGEGPVFLNNFFSLLLYKLRTIDNNALSDILEIGEGIENRIIEQVRYSDSFRNLVENIKSKRYTWTRIQRTLNYILMDYTKNDYVSFEAEGPQYIRVLASSGKGRKLLAKMRKEASLPVLTKVAPFFKKATGTAKKMLAYDLKSSDIYTLGYGNPNRYVVNRDFTTGPILLD